MSSRRRRTAHGILEPHSLSLALVAIIALWVLLYARADPTTHLGSFFGNAIADWLGILVMVVATKYFYEIGSTESRPPHPRGRSALMRLLIDHSLTILLVMTGAGWVAIYARMDPEGRAGEVVSNVVSEWTQILGIVVITKYAREVGSK